MNPEVHVLNKLPNQIKLRIIWKEDFETQSFEYTQWRRYCGNLWEQLLSFFYFKTLMPMPSYRWIKWEKSIMQLKQK
jgi:hypothetical protein